MDIRALQCFFPRMFDTAQRCCLSKTEPGPREWITILFFFYFFYHELISLQSWHFSKTHWPGSTGSGSRQALSHCSSEPRHWADCQSDMTEFLYRDINTQWVRRRCWSCDTELVIFFLTLSHFTWCTDIFDRQNEGKEMEQDTIRHHGLSLQLHSKRSLIVNILTTRNTSELH